MRLNEVADPEIYSLSAGDAADLIKQIEGASPVHMPDDGGPVVRLTKHALSERTKAPRRPMNVSQRRPSWHSS
jgi:hypothetical protein